MSLAKLGRKQHMAIAAIIAVGFFVLITLAAIGSPGFDQQPTGGAEDFGRLADAIFDTHVLALEALGILLTAALIGAMVIARPLGTQPDSIHYPTKRDAHGLEEVQAVSEVERNLGSGSFTPAPATGSQEQEEEE